MIMMTEETTNEEITIRIFRSKAFVMSKMPGTIIFDGQEIGKLKNGEEMKYTTTRGRHNIQIKAPTAISNNLSEDLEDGDMIVVSMGLVGWSIDLKR